MTGFEPQMSDKEMTALPMSQNHCSKLIIIKHSFIIIEKILFKMKNKKAL